MKKIEENIFETGTAWKIFNETEREFILFLEIVPFVPKHESNPRD
jgi:hypothetical protein